MESLYLEIQPLKWDFASICVNCVNIVKDADDEITPSPCFLWCYLSTRSCIDYQCVSICAKEDTTKIKQIHQKHTCITYMTHVIHMWHIL